jgi:hypothetical protein
LRKAQEWREVEVEGRDSFHPLTPMNRAIQRFDGRMEECRKTSSIFCYPQIYMSYFTTTPLPIFAQMDTFMQ